MTDLYTNLLKATDNTSDITTEKYGTVVKIDGALCSVKEYDTELEHSNVPIVNGADLKLGDKVIIGFLNNSIYDIVCYGVLDRTVEINWENVKDKPTVFPTDWENVQDKPSTFPPSSHNHVSSEVTDLINTIYPIGSIYMSVSSTSPQILFGGTWEQIKDTFLLASGDTYASDGDVATAQHGSATVSLTEEQMPRHTHKQNAHSHTIGSLARYTISGKGVASVGDGYGNSNNYKTGSTTATNKYTGGTNTTEAAQNGSAHENMPPYMAVYCWKRTA